MNKENCALKLVDEIILYYDARSKKHKKVQILVLACYREQDKKSWSGLKTVTHVRTDLINEREPDIKYAITKDEMSILYFFNNN